MVLKGFFTHIDTALLALLFSDGVPDFVTAESSYKNDTRALAWHALLTKNHGQLTDWLDAIPSPGFRQQMRYRLNECIAFGWLLQHDRKQITKMLNVLDAAESKQMREHLNYLKPFARQWKQRQVQQQLDGRSAA